MIKEVQTQAFAATSCNFPDMSIAPTTPDCILSLRDGSSIAATSARLYGLLAQHPSSHQPSSLPVYTLNQPPAAVKLLHSILEDEVDPTVGHMPSLSSIMQLAHLCAETGYTSLRESHIMPWTRRWMLSALQAPKADILRIALVCKDERAVMDIFRIFVLAKVSQNELRMADRLLPSLTDEREQLHRWDQLVVVSTDGVPVRLSVIRVRLRRDLRTLLFLPMADHPSILRQSESRHQCAAQALDLAGYIRALSQASLFPLPEDDSEMCLLWMGKRLEAAAMTVPYRQSCRECGFETSPWKHKFEAIEESLNTRLQSLLGAVDACLFGSSDGPTAYASNFF
jgi:hypothetical protein